MVTRIIAGTRDTATKKKLLAISPFPPLQLTVNLCRSEELARANERTLSGQSGVSAVHTRHGQAERHLGGERGACGRSAHVQGTTCPAVGRKCHLCDKLCHFSSKCPNQDKGKSGTGGATGSSGGSAKSKMVHITIGNVQTNQRQRGSPSISLELLREDGAVATVIEKGVPDPLAEVSVDGRDVMAAISLIESDLAASAFDLVMADRSTPLLSIRQRDIRVRYGGRSVTMVVGFCPEIRQMIRGILVCRLDCVELNILYRVYPKPLSHVRSVSFANPDVNAPPANSPCGYQQAWRAFLARHLYSDGAHHRSSCGD